MFTIARTLFTPGRRFGILLISLLLILILPFLLPKGLRIIFTPIFFATVLFSSLSAVAETRWRVGIGAALAVPSCVLSIVALATQAPIVTAVSEIIALVFLVYVAVTILAYILQTQRVDLGIVLGSVCVYLMIALIWGMGFHLIEQWQPGSFAIPPLGEGESLRNVLQYFSFVTLTTLGYGDIQPVSAMARLMSALGAMVGQLYLVVLVSRLVGLHVALESKRYDDTTTS